MKEEDEIISRVEKEIEEARLKQQEQELLFSITEAYRPEYIEEKETEIHFLTNGTAFSKRSIQELVQNAAGEYFPMFPNSKPFFKLMYKLNGWGHLNPNKFSKPSIVGHWIKRYIYGRFDPWVLEELLKKENPIVYEYVKMYKLFQFLDERGQMMMEGYIQDAIDVMEEIINRSGKWHDFEKAYAQKHKLSVQLRVWEE